MRELWPVLYIGTAFMLMFLSFNTLQVLLPHDRPTAGPLLIGLSYIGYAVGSLFAPKRQDSWGRRFTFALASLAFPVWDATLIFKNDFAISNASLIVGIASGILWAVQGSWIGTLSKRDPAKTGLMNGVFMVIYSSSTLLGQLLSATIVDTTTNWPQIIGIGLALFATIMLLVTPNHWLADPILYEINLEDFDRPLQEPRADDPSNTSWRIRLAKLWASQWRLLLPRIIVLGTVTSFIWIGIPLIIVDQQSLNWLFVVYSAASIVAYFTTGLLVDSSLPPKIIWSVNLGSLPLLYNIQLLPQPVSIWIAIVMVVSLAFVNSCCNNLITLEQARDLSQDLTTDAVAVQHFIYCIVYALCAAGYSLLGTIAVAEISVILCFIAIFTYI